MRVRMVCADWHVHSLPCGQTGCFDDWPLDTLIRIRDRQIVSVRERVAFAPAAATAHCVATFATFGLCSHPSFCLSPFAAT